MGIASIHAALAAIFISMSVVIAAPFLPLQSSITVPPPAVGGLAAQRADLINGASAGLFAQLKALPLDANSLIGEWLSHNPETATRLNKLLRDYVERAESRSLELGGRSLDLQLPLDKWMRQLLLGEMAFAGQDPDSSGRANPAVRLILDCRHLKVQPALAPRLLDEGGSELYALSHVNRQEALEHGLLDYARMLDPDEAAGQLQIKVQELSGRTGCDLVLSNPDAKLLEAEPGICRPGNILVLLGEEQ